ncbi:DUF5004 domain-containing protein [Tamlana sp. I1]|uniref:DUF5004 domain-containing protein n=1 Tax=Tamlana sp. I1 TaxID=2762061 RepID=UPI00188E6849|nr:DUF5004 domain-containing protein [Tamlana sp. I1]
MKSIKVLVFVFFGLLALGCNKSDDGSYVEPITIYEKMQGNWSLLNLKMVDQFAKANAIEPSEQNLSTLFNYDVCTMAFNVDANMEPTSYEISGNVPPIFQLKGYWGLSNAFQQANSGAIQIHLYSDAEKSKITDSLLLTSVPGSNEEMEVQLVRTSGGTPFISYVFSLTSNN